MRAEDVRTALRMKSNPEKALFFPRFFKSGPGEYAEGDRFLGVIVPDQRKVAKLYKHLSLPEVERLLKSAWHEERLTALFILVDQYMRGDDVSKNAIYKMYTANTKYVNNWDLVDSSAPYIVGPYLEHKSEKMTTLLDLGTSDLLWDRRIAMLSTFYYIKQGSASEALALAETLVHDNHDLIHKAVGWMLREVASRVDKALIVAFLNDHAATMPRTMLRYAIEKFPATERADFLARRIST